MRVTINKIPHDMPIGATLLDAALLAVSSVDHTALAINHRVIPRDAWGSQLLKEGDVVTIITAAMGG